MSRIGTRPARGSAAVEAALVVPAFLLLVGLIVYGGRTAITHQSLETAASNAARSGSIERSAPEAARAAEAAARTSIAKQDIPCVTVHVTSDLSGFRTPVGTDATFDVTVSCRLDLSDLAVPGVPGSRVLTASISSPIDTWRERS
ncbi:TadE family protein [Nocardioides sambongensis]|uniref:TadE family protein n=1 Tax=Nocardioides sambongensis TaxID=2589074 RepID=UPI001E5DF748|nr:TadE family protein [Nocardioides sambongensis]